MYIHTTTYIRYIGPKISKKLAPLPPFSSFPPHPLVLCLLMFNWCWLASWIGGFDRLLLRKCVLYISIYIHYIKGDLNLKKRKKKVLTWFFSFFFLSFFFLFLWLPHVHIIYDMYHAPNWSHGWIYISYITAIIIKKIKKKQCKSYDMCN